MKHEAYVTCDKCGKKLKIRDRWNDYVSGHIVINNNGISEEDIRREYEIHAEQINEDIASKVAIEAPFFYLLNKDNKVYDLCRSCAKKAMQVIDKFIKE